MTVDPPRATRPTMTASRRCSRASSGAATAPASGSATGSGSSEASACELMADRSSPHRPHLVGIQGAVMLGDPYHDAEEHRCHSDTDDDGGEAEVLQHRVG